MTIKEKYNKIVNLYEKQVNLSHRTSESIRLQQYSTAAPIAYIAGIYCRFDKRGKYFEPSAGNGLLTIAGKSEYFIVNEIDPVRNRNLKTQDFKLVLNEDASEPFTEYQKYFDAIITNPPFGKIDETVYYDEFPINSLEMLMALRALDTMKDGGRAAFIIGGHTMWDAQGRIQAGKNRIFFSYLYKHYNVEDVINISGKKLYARMGTGFDIRLVLINGRKKKPEGFPPLMNKNLNVYQNHSSVTVDNFDILFDRIKQLL